VQTIINSYAKCATTKKVTIRNYIYPFLYKKGVNILQIAGASAPEEFLESESYR
jgi:hypothetical protein